MSGGQQGSSAAEQGVYYSSQDYAGFFRRLSIEIIDVVVALALWLCLFVAIYMVLPDDEPPAGLGLLVGVFVLLGYFVLLKRSPIRTLGYKVCRARLVNLQGAHPGIPSLTLRVLFAVFGPLNFLVDMVWIPSDKHHQSLRDKFAHTYVVKDGAKPMGSGPIVYNSYHILGGSFIFAEVQPGG